ncbi:M14 family metallopeptidase [soil metagenome]
MIRLWRRSVVVSALAAFACSPALPTPSIARSDALPRTRAERSDYTETSRYADVVAFLDSLRAAGAPLVFDTLGHTTEGRAIPLVIASRPAVATPEEARRLGRPIVYVQGNIHAGEVEGKEALQALLRDLAFDPEPNVLDSIVLLAVPIYNADGNERFGPQAQNRNEQHGPEQVGERANAQGLDLNRDYVKAEAPETRAALELLKRWDPDAFVDLHTTDGSYHGYALTYSPSLAPAAGRAGAWTQDTLLPELRRRVAERCGVATFPYGNFARRYGEDAQVGFRPTGWYTYDPRPRFGTNYLGLRGRVSILIEAFSHDPFAQRVASTRAFVSELLSLLAERSDRLRELRRTPADGPASPVPIRSRLTEHPDTSAVVAERLAPDPDSTPDEPGVPPGVRRTGVYDTLRLPIHDRFEATLTVEPPSAYLLPPSEAAAVRVLRLHGVRVEELAEPRMIEGEAFAIDSLERAEQPFQGHREVRLTGSWERVRREVPPGWYRVPVAQPLGTVAVYLLEPESDDGLVTWNFFDAAIAAGKMFPVLRERAASP